MKKLILIVFTLMLSAVSYADIYQIPYMPAGYDPEHQGFIRISNMSGEQADITIRGYDWMGNPAYNELTLQLPAGVTRGFTMFELEVGSSDKGLVGGGLGLAGDWQLQIESDTQLQVNGFYRNPFTGFITALHDKTSSNGSGYHELPTVNPGSNMNQRGVIKIINPTDEAVVVRLLARDDAGVEFPLEGEPWIVIEVDPKATFTISTYALETGNHNFGENLGPLGDGAGKWRIRLEALEGDEFHALSLIQSPDGYLSNVTSNGSALPTQQLAYLSCQSLDGAVVVGDAGKPTYLGFFGDIMSDHSIMNPVGNYASPSYNQSIFNVNQKWGNDSEFSVLNSSATNPPVLLKDGNFLGYLTKNQELFPRIDIGYVLSECTFTATERSDLHPEREVSNPPQI